MPTSAWYLDVFSFLTDHKRQLHLKIKTLNEEKEIGVEKKRKKDKTEEKEEESRGKKKKNEEKRRQ